VESIQLQLLAKFKMKDLGEFGWILDMYAEWDSECVKLNTRQYIRDQLCRSQFENFKSMSIWKWKHACMQN
jgi:hypothetical protein